MPAHAPRFTSLILLATALTAPALAQQSASNKPAAPHIQKSSASDMTVTIEEADPSAAIDIPPPFAAPMVQRKPKAPDTPPFQISGTGELSPSFDAQSLARYWTVGTDTASALTLDLTVTRDGKIASCDEGSSPKSGTSNLICKHLTGQSLYRWPKGAPFPQERAFTRVFMELGEKPPYEQKFQIVKPGRGVPLSVMIDEAGTQSSCLAQVNDAFFAFTPERDNERLCEFAEAEAKKRGLRLPQAGDSSLESATFRTTTIEFSLKAAPDYVAGKPRPKVVIWQELPDNMFDPAPYTVQPLSQNDHAMPPIGRLVIPDMESDAERARARTFDPRNVAQGRLWDSRARVRILLDGSIASCEPLASYGAMWFDQYLCDVIKRAGRYEYRKPQPLPPGMKPDAKIHYLDVKYRSDGAFLGYYP